MNALVRTLCLISHYIVTFSFSIHLTNIFATTFLQYSMQGVEMQLGLAIESEKATLSVKRRLACEEVSYFSQVSD